MGSIVTRNVLTCWTDGAAAKPTGENNPRITDAVETEFTTIISTPSLLAVHTSANSQIKKKKLQN
jgi:hypothetical protein